MNVGAIGGAFCGAAGAAQLGGSQMAGVSTIGSSAVPAALMNPANLLSGMAATQLQSLVNLLQGFSSAEILLALWLLNNSNSSHTHTQGALALGLLNSQAGLNLLQNFNQFAAAGAYAMTAADAGMTLAAASGSLLNVQI